MIEDGNLTKPRSVGTAQRGVNEIDACFNGLNELLPLGDASGNGGGQAATCAVWRQGKPGMPKNVHVAVDVESIQNRITFVRMPAFQQDR